MKRSVSVGDRLRCTSYRSTTSETCRAERKAKLKMADVTEGLTAFLSALVLTVRDLDEKPLGNHPSQIFLERLQCHVDILSLENNADLIPGEQLAYLRMLHERFLTGMNAPLP